MSLKIPLDVHIVFFLNISIETACISQYQAFSCHFWNLEIYLVTVIISLLTCIIKFYLLYFFRSYFELNLYPVYIFIYILIKLFRKEQRKLNKQGVSNHAKYFICVHFKNTWLQFIFFQFLQIAIQMQSDSLYFKTCST